jgi:hypothetical protein
MVDVVRYTPYKKRKMLPGMYPAMEAAAEARVIKEYMGTTHFQAGCIKCASVAFNQTSALSWVWMVTCV